MPSQPYLPPPPPPDERALAAGFTYAGPYQALRAQGLVPVVDPLRSPPRGGGGARLVLSAVRAGRAHLVGSPAQAPAADDGDDVAATGGFAAPALFAAGGAAVKRDLNVSGSSSADAGEGGLPGGGVAGVGGPRAAAAVSPAKAARRSGGGAPAVASATVAAPFPAAAAADAPLPPPFDPWGAGGITDDDLAALLVGVEADGHYGQPPQGGGGSAAAGAHTAGGSQETATEAARAWKPLQQPPASPVAAAAAAAGGCGDDDGDGADSDASSSGSEDDGDGDDGASSTDSDDAESSCDENAATRAAAVNDDDGDAPAFLAGQASQAVRDDDSDALGAARTLTAPGVAAVGAGGGSGPTDFSALRRRLATAGSSASSAAAAGSSSRGGGVASSTAATHAHPQPPAPPAAPLSIVAANKLARAIARGHYGHAALRPGQSQAVQAALLGRDVLVLLPTGAGKTLAYVLPALVAPGVTVVVTPLLALMRDQVDGALRRGLPAAALSSDSPPAASRAVLAALWDAARAAPTASAGGGGSDGGWQTDADCVPVPVPAAAASASADGTGGATSSSPAPPQRFTWRERLKLLYVTPERMVHSDGLQAALAALAAGRRLARFVVDEAHCAVEWAADFRPEYGQLGHLRRAFPGVPLTAVTATATPQLQAELAATLGMVVAGPPVPAATAAGASAGTTSAPVVAPPSSSSSSLLPARPPAVRVAASVDRPNLFWEARRVSGGGSSWAALADDVAAFVGSPGPGPGSGAGIVYMASRAGCERLAAELDARLGAGTAAFYHGGLADGAERAARQDAWMSGAVRVMVATSAFGLGVDRADVRWVVHAGLPRALGAYQQEAGRAGRDGAPAHCLLLYTPGDAHVHEALLRRAHATASAAARAVAAGGGLPRPLTALHLRALRAELAEGGGGGGGGGGGVTAATKEQQQERALAALVAARTEPPSAAGLRVDRALAAGLDGLRQLLAWAEEPAGCRRRALLAHFGEAAAPGAASSVGPPPHACCDSCRYRAAVEGAAAGSAIGSLLPPPPPTFAFPGRLTRLLESAALDVGAPQPLAKRGRHVLAPCPGGLVRLDLTQHARLAVRAVVAHARGAWAGFQPAAAPAPAPRRRKGAAAVHEAASSSASSAAAAAPPAALSAAQRLAPGRDGFTLAQLGELLAAATKHAADEEKRGSGSGAADDMADAYDAICGAGGEDGAGFSASAAAPLAPSTSQMLPPLVAGGARLPLPLPKPLWTRLLQALVQAGALSERPVATPGPGGAAFTHARVGLGGRADVWRPLATAAVAAAGGGGSGSSSTGAASTAAAPSPPPSFCLTLRAPDLDGRLVASAALLLPPVSAAATDGAGSGGSASDLALALQLQAARVPVLTGLPAAAGRAGRTHDDDDDCGGGDADGASDEDGGAGSRRSASKAAGRRGSLGGRRRSGQHLLPQQQQQPSSPTPAVYVVSKIVQPERTVRMLPHAPAPPSVAVGPAADGGGSGDGAAGGDAVPLPAPPPPPAAPARVFTLFDRAALAEEARAAKAAAAAEAAAKAAAKAAKGKGSKKRAPSGGGSSAATAAPVPAAAAAAAAPVPAAAVPPAAAAAAVAPAAAAAAASAPAAPSGGPRCSHGNGPDCARCEAILARIRAAAAAANPRS